tara:strand:- start:61 stop:192 length:132 start_codon:yes stop_codon:yes gene_type:complete
MEQRKLRTFIGKFQLSITNYKNQMISLPNDHTFVVIQKQLKRI